MREHLCILTRLTRGKTSALIQSALPRLPSGVTTAADWSRLREAPSPWAEMEFDNIIITVPSDAVRNLERPDELAALWNDIMRAMVDLAALPQRLGRKERFVTDVQISHGQRIQFLKI